MFYGAYPGPGQGPQEFVQAGSWGEGGDWDWDWDTDAWGNPFRRRRRRRRFPRFFPPPFGKFDKRGKFGKPFGKFGKGKFPW